MPLDFNPLEVALTQAQSYLDNRPSEDDPSSPEYARKKARQKKIDEYQQMLQQQTMQHPAGPAGMAMGGFSMSPQTQKQGGSMLSSLLGMFSGGGGSYSPGAANMLF